MLCTKLWKQPALTARPTSPAKQGFTFHDLRHTFGSLAVQVWPLSDVRAYMGHADIQTTMRYAHHVPKAKAAAELSEFIRSRRSVVQPWYGSAQADPDQGRKRAQQQGFREWAGQDSNLRPTDYESAALTS